MKLYHTPQTCSLSPLIVLHETDLPFEVTTVDLRSKRTTDGEDLLAVTPKGQVPALALDDGGVLTEGAVIVQYLADRVPASKLAPAPGTMERTRLQEWLNFLASDVHKTFGAFWPSTVTPAHKDTLRATLAGHLSYLDRQVSTRPYLAGDSYTIADAYHFTVLGWAPNAPFEIDLAPSRHLRAFQDRIAARPAVQKALEYEAPLAA